MYRTFSSLPAEPMTLSPSRLASWPTIWPTAPEALLMKMVSPALGLPIS